MKLAEAFDLDDACAPSGGAYRVGLVVPEQGPAGIFGPSCEAVSQLAVEQINAEGGVLGRPLEFDVLDGGADPHVIRRQLDHLIRTRRIHAVTGWHISAVRQQLSPILDRRIPYVYTSLYEGGEQTPGVFCSGETPVDQVLPALRWLRDRAGVARWFIVGDDYVWPRVSAAVTRRYARHLAVSILGEAYVPLGNTNWSKVLSSIELSGANGVIMYLVGQDAVTFNRAFAAHNLHQSVIRFSPLMEENMLMASGSAATQSLFVAASYFRSLATAGAMDLMGDYIARFGPSAPPLNNAAESCYEGIRTLAELLRRARSTDIDRMLAVADSVGYDGPRGAMQMRRAHLRQPVYLARADGFDFDILTAL